MGVSASSVISSLKARIRMCHDCLIYCSHLFIAAFYFSYTRRHCLPSTLNNLTLVLLMLPPTNSGTIVLVPPLQDIVSRDICHIIVGDIFGHHRPTSPPSARYSLTNHPQYPPPLSSEQAETATSDDFPPPTSTPMRRV